ncbi:penicillin-binding transpeptidase domain-containing protein [Geobacter sp. OR-1]|uniref:penicillin-binding transpeptidase domain-containing protein n=1 Tax=Geobacter sp. OR-1 TaxID=1266765 RepID=UPI00351C5186
MRFILPVIACLLAAYPLFHLLVSAGNALSSVSRTPVPKEPASAKADGDNSFRLARELLSSSAFDGNRYRAGRPDGSTIYYAINPELQERVRKVMAENRVPYGVFVAVEPKTGRILAIAAHSESDAAWEAQAPYNLYPMASLFKIVTAAAALEQRKVTPETVMPFRGRLTSENPRYWEAGPRHGNQEMDLTTAMGKSVNPVFGRLASNVGKEGILSGMERFGFNQSLLPGEPILSSCGSTPQDDADLKRLGAGLCKEVKVSPLYAALMMAAVANKGVMLQPQLASEIRGSEGKLLYSGEPRQVRRVVSPETADQLSKMMSTTVSQGTSRKVFRDRRGRPKLAAVDIAAKTGSITGIDPPGHYSWFAAYAPINDPQIALAALVINGAKWRIKASLLGEQALEAFFR